MDAEAELARKLFHKQTQEFYQKFAVQPPNVILLNNILFTYKMHVSVEEKLSHTGVNKHNVEPIYLQVGTEQEYLFSSLIPISGFTRTPNPASVPQSSETSRTFN